MNLLKINRFGGIKINFKVITFLNAYPYQLKNSVDCVNILIRNCIHVKQ